MAHGRIHHALRYLYGLFGRDASGTRADRDLLEAFAGRRDEAAFAALVERHGPLVWGVCRRMLAHEQDAEDAFQATFLVLARKAGSVPWHADVGNWLYAVAVRVARKARGRSERQRLRERAAVVGEHVNDPDPGRAELAALIDEEVGRLPEKYRRPVVLCCLEGKTYVEAARLLGWPEGTTSARLSRARELLRRRLTRRGLALAALPAVFVPPAVAAPAALSALTARNAVAFAAGHGAPSAATDLAQGVFQTMLRSKVKVLTLTVAALALASAGTVLVARELADKEPAPRPAPPAEVTVVPDAPRPPIKKEWAGRWIADPFAGAEWIELRQTHNAAPGYRVYQIKDPQAVAAIVKVAKVIGVDNGIAAGCIPTATVIAHLPGGKTFSGGMCGGGETLMCDGGILTLADGFGDALNKAATAEAKVKVDLTQFALAPPEGAVVNPAPPQPTAKNLESGFSMLSVTYLVGRKLHCTAIDDATTLDALHRALVVKAAVPLALEGAESRNLQVTTKDKARFYFQVQNRESIVDLKVARFVLTPAFFEALNKEVSRRAGFDIDVTADDNKPQPKEEERVAEFRKLLGKVKSARYVEKRDGVETVVAVDDAKEATTLIAQLRQISVPARDLKLKPWNTKLELKLDDGSKVTLTFLDTGKDSLEAESQTAMPVLTDPVDVSGLGQLWLDNQWKYKFRDLVYQREHEAKERRDQETTRLVCADLPAFFKQVISVVVIDKNTRGVLPQPQTKKVLNSLAAGKFEKLNWSEERWKKEYDALGGEPGLELDLAPGLGYSLTIIPAGEKTILIPDVGRLVFDENPLPAIRKAIEEGFKE
jgi:RNA polymerase sigma factor (sigma-70 family)